MAVALEVWALFVFISGDTSVLLEINIFSLVNIFAERFKLNSKPNC